ncbi:MAG: hypothetical protein H7248_10300 [Microbacteriaceae bacterium]|nr:hypothetical protein [Microbacteriaceae bacterium]
MPTPSRRDRFRPLELLGLSFVAAIFIGLVVLMSSRQPTLALIFAGVTFIVTLVGLAMLAMVAEPDTDERRDLDEQNKENSGH